MQLLVQPVPQERRVLPVPLVPQEPKVPLVLLARKAPWAILVLLVLQVAWAQPEHRVRPVPREHKVLLVQQAE